MRNPKLPQSGSGVQFLLKAFPRRTAGNPTGTLRLSLIILWEGGIKRSFLYCLNRTNLIE